MIGNIKTVANGDRNAIHIIANATRKRRSGVTTCAGMLALAFQVIRTACLQSDHSILCYIHTPVWLTYRQGLGDMEDALTAAIGR